MHLDQAVVASKNRDKIAEVEHVLAEMGVAGEIVRGRTWPDVDETGATLQANALLKARAVAAATDLPAIADDTGLEVAALDGRPGVQTARFAGPDATYDDNVKALLQALESALDRRAVFRTVVALVLPGGGELTAEGHLEGVITRKPRGSRGFGYDPVFEVGGRTLAEMTDAEKNQISHRGRALRALGELLADRADGVSPE